MYSNYQRFESELRVIALIIVAATAVLLSHSAHSSGDETKPAVRGAIEFSDLWLEHQLAVQQLPSLVIGIVHGQDLIWSKGFGLADVEGQVPATPDTIYGICSITKVFTSVAVMQLRDRGKLQLTQEVGELLPWFGAEQAFPDSGPITVKGLLTHSSGLPHDLERPYWTEQSFPGQERFRELLRETKTLYPAATHEEYSNIGFALAGNIVEVVSGKPFASYVRTEILDPLGMDSTTLDIPVDSQNGRLARAYSGLGRERQRDTIPPYQLRGLAAAAGMASTVNDMAKFIKWQFRVPDNKETELLKASTLHEMFLVQWYNQGSQFHRGYGYSVADINGSKYVGKDGGCPGYQSLMLLNPASKVGGILMTNENGTDVWELLRGIFELMEPAIAMPAEAFSEPEPANSDLEQYAGVYSGYPSDMEAGIIVQGDHLAFIMLNSKSPAKTMVRLNSEGGRRFQKINKEGTVAGHLDFGTDAEGRIAYFTQPGSKWAKIR